MCIYLLIANAWYLRQDWMTIHLQLGHKCLTQSPKLDFFIILPHFGIIQTKYNPYNPLLLSNCTINQFFLDDDIFCAPVHSTRQPYKISTMLAYTKTNANKVQCAMSTMPRTSSPQLLAILDTWATIIAIDNKLDFKSINKYNMGIELKEIAAGCAIKGEGIVEYAVVMGPKTVTLCLQAYWVPSHGPEIRLISPKASNPTPDCVVPSSLTTMKENTPKILQLKQLHWTTSLQK